MFWFVLGFFGITVVYLTAAGGSAAARSVTTWMGSGWSGKRTWLRSVGPSSGPVPRAAFPVGLLWCVVSREQCGPRVLLALRHYDWLPCPGRFLRQRP